MALWGKCPCFCNLPILIKPWAIKKNALSTSCTVRAVCCGLKWWGQAPLKQCAGGGAGNRTSSGFPHAAGGCAPHAGANRTQLSAHWCGFRVNHRNGVSSRNAQRASAMENKFFAPVPTVANNYVIRSPTRARRKTSRDTVTLRIVRERVRITNCRAPLSFDDKAQARLSCFRHTG